MSDYLAEFQNLWAEDRSAIRDSYLAKARERDEARAELERTKAELEKAQTQRDAMFHEIETLRGKTGYCIGCEVSAQKLADAQTLHVSASAEADDLRAENAKIREAGEAVINSDCTTLGVFGPSAKDRINFHKVPRADIEALRAAVGGGEESDGE